MHWCDVAMDVRRTYSSFNVSKAWQCFHKNRITKFYETYTNINSFWTTKLHGLVQRLAYMHAAGTEVSMKKQRKRSFHDHLRSFCNELNNFGMQMSLNSSYSGKTCALSQQMESCITRTARRTHKLKNKRTTELNFNYAKFLKQLAMGIIINLKRTVIGHTSYRGGYTSWNAITAQSMWRKITKKFHRRKLHRTVYLLE